MTPELEALKDRAEALDSASNHLEAMATWLEVAYGALDAYEFGDPRTHAAMNRVVAAFLDEGSFNEPSLENSETDARALAEALGPDSPEALAALETAGRFRYLAGDLKGARERLARTADLAGRALGPAHPLTISARRWLAQALPGLGKVPEAGLELAAALGACAGGRGPAAQCADAAEAADKLAERMRNTGYGNEADALLASASGVLRSGEAPLPSAMAQFDETTATLRALAALGETRGLDSPNIADGLDAHYLLALVHSVHGDYAGAWDALSLVAAQRLNTLGPAHPGTVDALLNLASVTGALGDLKGEREMLDRAIAGAAESLPPDHPSVLSLKAALAMALAGSGDTEAGTALAREVFEKRETALGPEAPDTLRSKGELAELLVRQGGVAEPRRMLAEALEAALRTEGQYGELPPWTAALLAESYSRAGEAAPGIFFLKVTVHYEEALRNSMAELDRDLRRSYLKTVESRYRDLFSLLAGDGRTSEAVAVLGLLKEDESRSLDLPPIPSLDAPGAPVPALPAGPPAASAGEARRRQEADLFAGTRDEAAWRAYGGAAARCASLEGERSELEGKKARGSLSAEEEARLAELPALAAEARDAFIGLCLDIRELLGAKGESYGVAPASWTAGRVRGLQEALSGAGPGAALLFAVSLEESLWLVTVAPGSLAAKKSGIGRDELSALALEFRGLVSDPRLDPRPAAKRLWDAVIGPAEADLSAAGAAELMLSLDGELRYAPAAAFWDGERWLAERYPTAIFTETTREKLSGPAYSGGPSIRALGVTAAWPGFPALPGVAAELAAVVRSDAPPGSPGGALAGEARLDAAFDRAALELSLASGAPVVHLASHFNLDPFSLEKSALLLGDGGTISLSDFKSGGGLDFEGLDLVTLSACDTASGARRGGGREVESLGEVLQMAGASSVLATLMPVDDGTAPALMREFYRLRYAEGMDKARALRGAQLLVMGSGAATEPAAPDGAGPETPGQEAPAYGPATAKRAAISAAAGAAVASAGRWDGKGHSHPYYWSPFVVMGSWK
jgi:CHAT domain-containing protein